MHARVLHPVGWDAVDVGVGCNSSHTASHADVLGWLLDAVAAGCPCVASAADVAN